MSLQLLHRNQIDTTKWDGVITNSSSGLLYALSIYLDGCCNNWMAIIMGDYEYIMPLPVRKKWGISYLYQAIGLAQGGIYSTKQINKEIEHAFLTTLLKHFKFATIHLNENFTTTHYKNCVIKSKTNFILDLNHPYETLFKNYNKDGRKNINQTKKIDQYITYNTSAEITLNLYFQQYENRGNIKKQKKEYFNYAILLKKLIEHKLAFAIAVKNNNNEIIASAIFGQFKNRIYYLFGAPNEEGKEKKSIHFLLNAVIEQYAQTNILLDFEGSEIPSVASFYKKFGPINQPYYVLHFNQLHPIMKLLKK